MRGLPVLGTLFCPGLRIIPARAGFTWFDKMRGMFDEDHPRACGVYFGVLRVLMLRRGSSPRVRGLLIHIHRARATALDHPRACGVYASVAIIHALAIGSSPRVRGLLVFLTNIIKRLGIIPARAGFTRYLSEPFPMMKDHPRACGVYTWRSLESQRSWSLPPPGFLHC